MVLDSKGRQVVRLIGFGERYETREPVAAEGWLGVSNAAGHVQTSPPPWWNDDPPLAAAVTAVTWYVMFGFWLLFEVDGRGRTLLGGPRHVAAAFAALVVLGRPFFLVAAVIVNAREAVAKWK